MDKIANFCLDGITPEGKTKRICIEDFLDKGKYIVIYFYPRDNTPGCTKEACDFRDNMERISEYAFVLGISPDSIDSHIKFHRKNSLNFYLLSDPDKRIIKLFEVWGEKKMYGKVREGVIRSTFIISPDGEIVKFWKNVKVKGHVDKVISELKSLIGE